MDGEVRWGELLELMLDNWLASWEQLLLLKYDKLKGNNMSEKLKSATFFIFHAGMFFKWIQSWLSMWTSSSIHLFEPPLINVSCWCAAFQPRTDSAQHAAQADSALLSASMPTKCQWKTCRGVGCVGSEAHFYSDALRQCPAALCSSTDRGGASREWETEQFPLFSLFLLLRKQRKLSFFAHFEDDTFVVVCVPSTGWNNKGVNVLNDASFTARLRHRVFF